MFDCKFISLVHFSHNILAVCLHLFINWFFLNITPIPLIRMHEFRVKNRRILLFKFGTNLLFEFGSCIFDVGCEIETWVILRFDSLMSMDSNSIISPIIMLGKNGASTMPNFSLDGMIDDMFIYGVKMATVNWSLNGSIININLSAIFLTRISNNYQLSVFDIFIKWFNFDVFWAWKLLTLF